MSREYDSTLRDHVDALTCWRAMQRAAVLAMLNDTDPQAAMAEAARAFLARRIAHAVTGAFEQAIRKAQHDD